MNTTRTADAPGPVEPFAERLEALNRAYQWFGLTRDDAIAATFADAEHLFRNP